ncbi:MAG: hypothetical protein GY769_19330 [bacterium]|nr:hypothetical protein [bacterium]
MSTTDLERLFLASRTFLLPGPDDFRLLLGEEGGDLPFPQRIFLEDEEATPVMGFPVLQTRRGKELRSELERAVRAEIEVEAAMARGAELGLRKREAAWKGYRGLLRSALFNSIRSSFGRNYQSVFWLYHSIAISRVLKEAPRRLLEMDSKIGKKYGSKIKYHIFNRFLDRILEETYDIAQQVAEELDQAEENLFPKVLERMRDNVLIFTEDHISPDLRELADYLQGYVGVDAGDFRTRFEAMSNWHVEQLETDADLRNLVRSFLGLGEIANPWNLLIRPGYVRFLSERPRYSPKKGLSLEQVEVWESLLRRLKEFELLAGLRRFVVPVVERDGILHCPAATLRGRRSPTKEVMLSYSTRPMDFLSAWVVDPLVRRFGLIYDITDFSAIVSMIRRSGGAEQDASFRQIFGFQSRVDRLARAHKLQLEKYLGDGALYSGRHPTLLLAAAIRLQRFYRQVLEDDFPFDRGLRIALNYGPYRLLPIQGTGTSHHYEFFGHGIVELTRLVSGKSTHDLDDTKALLLSSGYSAVEVDRFFAPVTTRRSYRADSPLQQGQFHASINASGVLINEGIAATSPFITEVSNNEDLIRMTGTHQEKLISYVVCEVDDGVGPVGMGIRQLGAARLKGLGDVVVFEIVDAEHWSTKDLKPPLASNLLDALSAQYKTVPQPPQAELQPFEVF